MTLPHQTCRDLIFLLFWGFSFCVIGIGWGSLASWDEAYYALVSKEIFQTGEWLDLTLFGTPTYDKPPLYVWATAFFYHLFGVNEFATRLFSGLSGVAVVLTVYFLGRFLFSRTVALLGAGILLSSTDFLHYARWGVLDITHLFFFTMTIFCFLRARSREMWYLFFWVASAGAFMTKGPLIVLAYGILFFHGLWIGDLGFLRKKTFWFGIPVMLALILPWHLYAYLSHPKVFLHDIIFKHYFLRTFVGVEGHTGNAYFYVRTLINKFHPWVVGLAFALPFVALRSFGSDEKARYRLLVIWIAIVFGFFTFLIKTKLSWYILLCYPALALTIAVFLAEWTKERYKAWVKPGIIVVLLLHIPFSGVMVQDYSSGIKALAPSVKELIGKHERLCLYKFHEQPAAEFYSERRVVYIDSELELDQWLETADRVVILAQTWRFEEEKGLFESRGFQLIQRTEDLRDDAVLLQRT